MSEEERKEDCYRGIYRELFLLLGEDATWKIYQEFKGQQINFPIRLYNRDYVIARVRKQKGQATVNEMAKEHGYSEKWIRNMMKED